MFVFCLNVIIVNLYFIENSLHICCYNTQFLIEISISEKPSFFVWFHISGPISSFVAAPKALPCSKLVYMPYHFFVSCFFSFVSVCCFYVPFCYFQLCFMMNYQMILNNMGILLISDN